MRRALHAVLVFIAVVSAAGCAGMPGVGEPLQVTVADIESIPSEGLEARMMVKLRVQNPNDTPVEYNGVYVKLDVMGKTLATGVSDEPGAVPRFGESVIEVPVTISLLRLGVSALGIFGNGQSIEKLHYSLEGKLNGSMFGSTSFRSQGELSLPGAAPQ
jgi:LEA14-like dessication related protein